MNTTPTPTSTSTSTSTVATSGIASRLTILALLTVFMLPLLLAWLFAKGPLNWQPQNNLNYGVLLQPPLHLNSYGVVNVTGEALTVDAIARDWFVVVLLGGTCAESCQQMIEAAEQIQLAVGRNIHRVNLALLSANDEAKTTRGLNWRLPADEGLVQELRRALGEVQNDAQLLIVDYRGYVVLSYPSTEEGLGVLEDLKRLLRSAVS